MTAKRTNKPARGRMTIEDARRRAEAALCLLEEVIDDIGDEWPVFLIHGGKQLEVAVIEGAAFDYKHEEDKVGIRLKMYLA